MDASSLSKADRSYQSQFDLPDGAFMDEHQAKLQEGLLKLEDKIDSRCVGGSNLRALWTSKSIV